MSEQIFNTKDLVCKIVMLKGEKGDPGTNTDTTARQMIESEATTRAQEIARLEAQISHPEIADGSISTEKLADGSVTGPKLASESVTAEKIAENAVRLRFQNIFVPVSAFERNHTYSDFPFRADVALNGATAAMRPDVCFSLADAISGIFAPVANSYDGGVYIYASDVPESVVSIPVIDLVR